MRYEALPIAVGLYVALAAGAVAAQDQDDASSAAVARALFEEGVGFADRREWEPAADRFERAYQLRPSPVIANNLALAYIAVGRLVEASEYLRRVARDESSDPGVREAAQAELDRLMPRMGRMAIEVEGSTEGVELAIDGRPMGLAVVGTAIPADPGTRTVTASRGGSELAREEVAVAAGGTARVTLELPEAEGVGGVGGMAGAVGAAGAAPSLFFATLTLGLGDCNDADCGASGSSTRTNVLLGGGVGVYLRPFPFLAAGLDLHYNLMSADHTGAGRTDEHASYWLANFAVRGIAAMGEFEPWGGVGLGFAGWTFGYTDGDEEYDTDLTGLDLALSGGADLRIADHWWVGVMARVAFPFWNEHCRERVDPSGPNLSCSKIDELDSDEQDDLTDVLWYVGLVGRFDS